MRNLFRKITAGDMARDELHQARRELLVAESNAEYWDAQAVYNRQRIERLEAIVEDDESRPAWPRSKTPPLPHLDLPTWELTGDCSRPKTQQPPDFPAHADGPEDASPDR